jgi:hypothetical protein
VRFWQVAISTLILAHGSSARAAALAPEVKAELLDRFARFVEWPASAFEASDSPFVLCVIGNDSITTYLRRLTDRKIQGRPLTVRRLGTDDFDSCHLLFIASSERYRLEEILEVLGERPILTVGDTRGFAREGVMINLFIERGTVRFEVNQTAAQRRSLKLSSGLLRLSRLVDRGPPLEP